MHITFIKMSGSSWELWETDIKMLKRHHLIKTKHTITTDVMQRHSNLNLYFFIIEKVTKILRTSPRSTAQPRGCMSTMLLKDTVQKITAYTNEHAGS